MPVNTRTNVFLDNADLNKKWAFYQILVDLGVHISSRLYQKLNPTSLREAIRRDGEKASTHQYDDRERSATTASTTNTASIVGEEKSGTTCLVAVENSQSRKTSKKKCQDWNGTGEEEDDDALYLGLRVYTKSNVVVTIDGGSKSKA